MSNNARSWSPEEQASINRTVRALADGGMHDWENRIAELEKPGQRRLERPAPVEVEQ